MLPRLCDARYEGGFTLWVRFNDGVEGLIDLKSELWGDVFDPLKDPREFARVALDRELGTVVWPGGADFAPEFLYQKLCSLNPYNPDAKSPGG